MPQLRLAPLLVCTLACSSGGTLPSYVADSTLVVDPAEFDVECGAESDAGPALRTYVATLIKLDTNDQGKATESTVTSSPPTACNVPVRFARSGEKGKTDSTPQFYEEYVVDLFGYEQTGLKAKTAGGAVVELDGEQVEPAWNGSCGRHMGDDESSDYEDEYFGPRKLVEGNAVVFRGCTLQLSDAQ